jgi:hypothetical protein
VHLMDLSCLFLRCKQSKKRKFVGSPSKNLPLVAFSNSFVTSRQQSSWPD